MPGRGEPSRKETETVWRKVEKSRRKSGLETWNEPCRTAGEQVSWTKREEGSKIDEAEQSRTDSEMSKQSTGNSLGAKVGRSRQKRRKMGKNDDANWGWASLDISDNSFDFGQSLLPVQSACTKKVQNVCLWTGVKISDQWCEKLEVLLGIILKLLKNKKN